MNGQWGSREARESANTLVLGLKEAALQAVPDFIEEDRDPTEILGEIFTALRKQYPDEYHVALRAAAAGARVKKCRACDKKAWKRGYCSTHYEKARKAGDIPTRSRKALTEQERIDIKWAEGTYRQIAECFGVSISTVKKCKRGD